MELQNRLTMSLDDIIMSDDTVVRGNKRARTNGGRRYDNNRGHKDSNHIRNNNSLNQKRFSANKERNSGIPPQSDCGLKFLMPNHLTGSLIGVGGKAIRELMEISGASVHVSNSMDFYPGTNDRVIYITGTESEVSLAQSLVWEMIGQQTFDSDGSLGLGWEPAKAKDSPGEYDNVEVSGKISIPVVLCGVILGRGGATIKAIAEESSVSLVMDGKEMGSEVTQERVLTIVGTAAGCMNCTSLVLAKLLEASPSSRFEYYQKGTTYPRSMLSSFGLVDNTHHHAKGSGDSDSIGHSGRAMVRKVRKESGHFRGGGGGSMNSSSSHIKAAVSGAETLSASTVIELGVADHLVGAILGMQGQGINEIISLSGAKVTVSKRGEYVEGTNNRLVTITGSPAAAQTAHTLVMQKLKAARVSD